MLVMLGKESNNEKYAMLDIDYEKGLHMNSFKCSNLDLVRISKESDKEFSEFLLNSNFQVKDDVKPGLLVDEFSKDSDISFEFEEQNTVIESLIVLIRTNGYVTFKHNSKKIVSSNDFNTTSFFKDSEPVFLNKTVSVSVKKIKVIGSSVVVGYEIDGVNYFFELLKASSSGLTLNDFTVSLPKEEFIKVESLLKIEALIETRDLVTFRLAKMSYTEIENYKLIPCVLSGLFSRQNTVKCILEAVNLFNSRTSLESFKKWYQHTERCGLSLKSDGLTWQFGKEFYLLDAKTVEKKWDSIREFLAMIEFGPNKDFIFDRGDKDSCCKLLIECDKIFRDIKNYDFEELESELLALNLIILKFITMLVISDEEVSENEIWIPTNYGQEVIKLEVKDNGGIMVF